MNESLFPQAELSASSEQTRLGDNERSTTQRFWLGLLYASLIGYWAASLTVIGYAALTWDQPNRPWLIGSAIIALVCAAPLYSFRYRIITSTWRVVFFGAWSTLSFAFLVLICALDGGVRSVLTVFLLLPMVYLASGYPLRAVQICGGLGLASYVILIGFSPWPVSIAIVLLQAIALAIGWLLAMLGAMNRTRQSAELRRLRLKLEQQATTDELTGCLNTRGFMQALNREMARSSRYGHSVALLVIDVDHFKRVNDHHGHLMGDEVLRQIGALLRQTARQGDIAGRPGGDELALLAPETDQKAACTLAERLLGDMRAAGHAIQITLSIGVCVAAADTESAVGIFRRADRALYQAKQRGRNQVAVCDNGCAGRTFGSCAPGVSAACHE